MLKVCTKCGEEKPESGFRLYKESGKFSSACLDCNRAEQRARDRAAPRRTYTAEQNRTWFEKNYVGYLLSNAKARAKKKRVRFSLTREDIVVPDVCPVLSIPLTISDKGHATDNSPNLDRLDPSKGYVRGNVVVISNKANRIKNNATSDEVQAVADWMKKKGL